MKIKSFIIITLFSSLITCPSKYSQTQPDTSYFPLAIGNQWVYEATNYPNPDTITVVDTQTVNGKLYFAFRENSSSSYRYTWYSNDNNKIYIVDTLAARLDSPNIREYMIYDFSANTGNSWGVPLADYNLQCKYAGTVKLESKRDSVEKSNDKLVNCYQFSRIVPCVDAGRINEWFAAGIGRVAFYDESIAGIREFTLSFTNVITGVESNNNSRLISNYKLAQNYPNPFNPTTTINYSIPRESFVTIKVFDPLGRWVETLVNETKQAGNYSTVFNAVKLASGIYYYQLKAGNYSETKKMTLLK
jgi:hypothetical protein